MSASERCFDNSRGSSGWEDSMADTETLEIRRRAVALEPYLAGRSFPDWKTEFDTCGFVIFPHVLSQDTVEQIKHALAPHFSNDVRGRNDFEGLKSNRVYAMLAKSPVFAQLVTHSLALAFAEAELGRSCLLSACLAIKLHPGETAQPWHYDDSHCGLPWPRRAYGVSTFWAIDDTTDENGATEVMAGSHLWENGQRLTGISSADSFSDTRVRDVEDDPGYQADAVRLTMPAGSLAIAKGTLWHRGGANRSDAPRTIITPQYCSGFMRPLENMTLAVPPDVARRLPARAQELIGYNIHPPFMGYVDGMHPSRVLNGEV